MITAKIADRNGPDWIIIRDAVTKRIEACRDELEAPGKSSTDSENLRGQIAALRSVLLMEEPDTPIPAPTSSYSLIR